MRANPLAAINSVAVATGRFSSLQEMVDDALVKVLEVVGTEAGSVYLLDEEHGELTVMAQRLGRIDPALRADPMPTLSRRWKAICTPGIAVITRNIRHARSHGEVSTHASVQTRLPEALRIFSRGADPPELFVKPPAGSQPRD